MPPEEGARPQAMIAVRKKLETHCGKPTKQWQPLGLLVYISGVGLFDIPHTQNPHAGNFAELHPVTAQLYRAISSAALVPAPGFDSHDQSSSSRRRPSARVEIFVEQRPFEVSPLSFNWL